MPVSPRLTFPVLALTGKINREGVREPLKLDFTTNNVESCKILVQDGKSISMSLMEDIDHEIETGILKALSLPDDFLITIDAILNRNIVTSPAIQDFIACLKATFRNPKR